MSVAEMLQQRISVRAYTDEPVDAATVRALLDTARWSPSGQPATLEGDRREWRRQGRGRAHRPGNPDEEPAGEAGDHPIYPEGLAEPYRTRRHAIGEALYARLGIPVRTRPPACAPCRATSSSSVRRSGCSSSSTVPWAMANGRTWACSCSRWRWWPRSAAWPPACRKPGAWCARACTPTSGCPGTSCSTAPWRSATPTAPHRSTSCAPNAPRWRNSPCSGFRLRASAPGRAAAPWLHC